MALSLTAALAGLGCTNEPGTAPDRAPDDPTPDPSIPDPFQLDRSQPGLLPFDVRLSRVAQVVGLEPTDPLFDEVRARRIDLGDYDYASGVLPDSTWSSSRIALWTRLMVPVCRSDATRARYPNLPDDLESMMTNAYGREPTADELGDVEMLLFESTLGPEATYQAVCLAVLGSAELLFR